MGTSWDVCACRMSLRYVLPVARTCAISLHHGTKYLTEVTSQGC